MLDSKIVEASVTREYSIEEKVVQYANFYEVNKDIMLNVMKCENKEMDPELQSYYPNPKGPNGREDSWGLVQIHLPAHKDITKEQAQNIDFSIDFLAKSLKAKQGRMWTCFRKLYPNETG